MAVAKQAVPQIVSIDDAVEACWQLVMEGEEKKIPDAVYRLWPTFRFNHEAISMLALEGFLERVKDTNYHARRDGRAPIAYGAPHGKAWDKYLRVLGTPYRGADATKPLIEFTLTDLAAWATYNRNQANAYTARAEWASKVEELLTEHGAVKVGKLPAAVLTEIAAELAEIVER